MPTVCLVHVRLQERREEGWSPLSIQWRLTQLPGQGPCGVSAQRDAVGTGPHLHSDTSWHSVTLEFSEEASFALSKGGIKAALFSQIDHKAAKCRRKNWHLSLPEHSSSSENSIQKPPLAGRFSHGC